MYRDMSGSMNIPGKDNETMELALKDDMITIRTAELGLSLTSVQTRLLHILLNHSEKMGELDAEREG